MKTSYLPSLTLIAGAALTLAGCGDSPPIPTDLGPVDAAASRPDAAIAVDQWVPTGDAGVDADAQVDAGLSTADAGDHRDGGAGGIQDQGAQVDDDGGVGVADAGPLFDSGGPTSSWTMRTPLPSVSASHGCALGEHDSDGSVHLGFMFTDSVAQAALIERGILWQGGGVFEGRQTLAIYQSVEDGEMVAWEAYQGRTTPQIYAYSELHFHLGSSYYTTSYAAFGGLLSVVKDGRQGAYALTPAFTDRKAHSVDFIGGTMWALIAQASGLTITSHPTDAFGLSSSWSNHVTLQADASSVHTPILRTDGTALYGAYVHAGTGRVFHVASPEGLSRPRDVNELMTCANAVGVDLLLTEDAIAVACTRGDGSFTIDVAPLRDPGAFARRTTAASSNVTETQLFSTGAGVGYAVRIGADEVRVFDDVADAAPALSHTSAGEFRVQGSSVETLVAFCPEDGESLVSFGRDKG